MKRLILNRRISELQAARMRVRRINLLGAEAVEKQEYAMLDQLYNGPPPPVVTRITAKMKQAERKRQLHQAQLAKEKAERDARLQAMDEASRAAAEAEEEERIRKKEAKDAERAARKLERAAQKRHRRSASDDEDGDEPKKKKVALSPADQESALRLQLDELTDSLTKQNTEKVQLFEALKHVLNRESKKLKAKKEANAQAQANITKANETNATGTQPKPTASVSPAIAPMPTKRMNLIAAMPKKK